MHACHKTQCGEIMLLEACGSLCKVLFMGCLLLQTYVCEEKRSKNVYIDIIIYIYIQGVSANLDQDLGKDPELWRSRAGCVVETVVCTYSQCDEEDV